MSISNLEEITCPCGEVFEAELLSAISVSDDPELKEALIAGEVNLVKCPKCGEMFYAECFILYHDSANELIAFVYPLTFQDQASQCRKKMQEEFRMALENFSEKQKINYEPLLIFGIEDLALLLKAEQELEDEEMVLSYLAPRIALETIRISPSLARKMNIPRIFPVPKGIKAFKTLSVIEGLKTLVKYNSNLIIYKKFLDKVLKNKSLFEDIEKETAK